MTPESFGSYNRAHGIGAGILGLATLLLPMLTNGSVGPRGGCPAAVVAPPVEAVAPAVTVPTPDVTVPTPIAAPVGVPPAARVYFATNRIAVARATSDTALALVIAYLKANPTAKASIVGYHDPRGSAAANAALAKGRAQTVGAALRRAGIADDRVVLETPVETTGTGSLDEARRVEVSVRP